MFQALQTISLRFSSSSVCFRHYKPSLYLSPHQVYASGITNHLFTFLLIKCMLEAYHLFTFLLIKCMLQALQTISLSFSSSSVCFRHYKPSLYLSPHHVYIYELQKKKQIHIFNPPIIYFPSGPIFAWKTRMVRLPWMWPRTGEMISSMPLSMQRLRAFLL